MEWNFIILIVSCLLQRNKTKMQLLKYVRIMYTLSTWNVKSVNWVRISTDSASLRTNTLEKRHQSIILHPFVILHGRLGILPWVVSSLGEREHWIQNQPKEGWLSSAYTYVLAALHVVILWVTELLPAAVNDFFSVTYI